MTQNGPKSLWNALTTTVNASDSFVSGGNARIARAKLLKSSILGGRAEELRGKSVVLMTADQFSTALALFELDGLARRIAICPSDFRLDSLPRVLDATGADALISDRTGTAFGSIQLLKPQPNHLVPQNCDRSRPEPTEWITFTSGTMGFPKLVVHSLASLTGAIDTSTPASRVVWGTLYDIRRFGGLQVFLRAALTGASLALPAPREPAASYLARAGSLGVTHISGTPSQWRSALIAGAAGFIAPEYLRLSGEIADQAILNHLRAAFPQAAVVHAFGSSEAGTVFEVRDGAAGFPADLLENAPQVELKVENGTLRVRSDRTARSYLGIDAPPLKDADGFVDTGDAVGLRDGRYHFAGRRDARINVGGLKVHPEEVEAVINRHPDVRMSLVRSRKSPVTGAVVAADVVLCAQPQPGSGGKPALRNQILQFCHASLAAHKVPAVIRFVPSLAIAESGKIARDGK